MTPSTNKSAASSGEQTTDPLPAIKQAIADYHYALDTRQHGGLAQDAAFHAICLALGMSWKPGQELSARAEERK